MTEQKPKKRAYREKYYDIPEDEIQLLIAQAKKGDGAAQLRLLEVFDNFLSKFVALLYNGKYSLENYDTRRFLSLFIKDNNIRFFLIRNKLNAAASKQVYETVRGIIYMVQRYGDEEDVRQTVYMAFLDCLNVYQPQSSSEGGIVPFKGFLYSYFFYVLKKKVDAFLIDQLGRKTFPLIDNEEALDWEGDGEDTQPGFTAPPTPGVDTLIGVEEIDEYWVMGDTASGPFKVLNVQERQLLRWRFVDGERSSDIAHRITEHPNTVREHFNRIRQKLREYLEEELKELA